MTPIPSALSLDERLAREADEAAAHEAEVRRAQQEEAAAKATASTKRSVSVEGGNERALSAEDLCAQLGAATLFSAPGTAGYRSQGAQVPNAGAVQQYVAELGKSASLLVGILNEEYNGKTIQLWMDGTTLKYENGEFIFRGNGGKEIGRMALGSHEIPENVLPILYKVRLTDEYRNRELVAVQENPDLNASADKLSQLRVFAKLAEEILRKEARPKPKEKTPEGTKLWARAAVLALALLGGGVGITAVSQAPLARQAEATLVKPEYNPELFEQFQSEIKLQLEAGKTINAILTHYKHQYEAELAFIEALKTLPDNHKYLQLVQLSDFHHEGSQLAAIALIESALKEELVPSKIVQETYDHALTSNVRNALDVSWKVQAIRYPFVLTGLLQQGRLSNAEKQELLEKAQATDFETVLLLPDKLRSIALSKCITIFLTREQYKKAEELIKDPKTRRTTIEFLARRKIWDGDDLLIKTMAGAMTIEEQKEILDATREIFYRDSFNFHIFKTLFTPQLQREFIQKLAPGLSEEQILFLKEHAKDSSVIKAIEEKERTQGQKARFKYGRMVYE